MCKLHCAQQPIRKWLHRSVCTRRELWHMLSIPTSRQYSRQTGHNYWAAHEGAQFWAADLCATAVVATNNGLRSCSLVWYSCSLVRPIWEWSPPSPRNNDPMTRQHSSSCAMDLRCMDCRQFFLSLNHKRILASNQNIARIAKAALHKLPGKPSLNVRSVCLVYK